MCLVCIRRRMRVRWLDQRLMTIGVIEMPKYVVEILRTREAHASIPVEAESEEKACEAAEKIAQTTTQDWEQDDESYDVGEVGEGEGS